MELVPYSFNKITIIFTGSRRFINLLEMRHPHSWGALLRPTPAHLASLEHLTGRIFPKETEMDLTLKPGGHLRGQHGCLDAAASFQCAASGINLVWFKNTGTYLAVPLEEVRQLRSPAFSGLSRPIHSKRKG